MRVPRRAALIFTQRFARGLATMSEMPTSYSDIAGQSVERLAALSDGVFAIAMTLLVLDLRVPANASVHGDADLFRHVFVTLAPRVVPYLLSFMTLGIF